MVEPNQSLILPCRAGSTSSRLLQYLTEVLREIISLKLFLLDPVSESSGSLFSLILFSFSIYLLLSTIVLLICLFSPFHLYASSRLPFSLVQRRISSISDVANFHRRRLLSIGWIVRLSVEL